MGLASTLGARAAGAESLAVDAIGAFGREVGTGLQMLDDWSSVKREARREKGIEDLRLNRPTWPWAWLAESDNQLAFAEVVRKVRDASIDWEFDQARRLMASRIGAIAPEAIRAHFARALSTLRSELGSDADLEAVETELEILVEAYG